MWRLVMMQVSHALSLQGSAGSSGIMEDTHFAHQTVVRHSLRHIFRGTVSSLAIGEGVLHDPTRHDCCYVADCVPRQRTGLCKQARCGAFPVPMLSSRADLTVRTSSSSVFATERRLERPQNSRSGHCSTETTFSNVHTSVSVARYRNSACAG